MRQAIGPAYPALSLTQTLIRTPTRPTPLTTLLTTPLLPGRLVALLDRSGVTLGPPPAGVHRCASGTPLRSAGVADVPRPLVGGCAREIDPSYDPSVEVHVPQVCSTCLPIYIYLSAFLSCLELYVSTVLPIVLFVHLSIYLPSNLPTYLPTYLSIHLPIYIYHLPQACVEPIEAEHVGCMMPAALNFDARAVQPSARCRYMLRGCNCSSALNFNPEVS